MFQTQVRNILEIENHVFLSIEKIENDILLFKRDDGRTFKFYHKQEYNESVQITNICGDLDDLVGTPIILAEERVETKKINDYDYCTFTFYEFRTIKGSVTITWQGEQSEPDGGCYSESVDFEEILEKKEPKSKNNRCFVSEEFWKNGAYHTANGPAIISWYT